MGSMLPGLTERFLDTDLMDMESWEFLRAPKDVRRFDLPGRGPVSTSSAYWMRELSFASSITRTRESLASSIAKAAD
jgi:hypothetical protein